LLPQAIAALSEELQGPNRLRAAATVLRACGMAEMSAPGGSTDPAAIEAEDRDIAAELARRNELSTLGIFAG
jgi:hypothetical protein